MIKKASLNKYIYGKYLLSFVKTQGEVMSSVLCLESVPVKVVRIEDMDESTEGKTIVPTRGEVGHRDRVILQTVLHPHKDHLLGA